LPLPKDKCSIKLLLAEQSCETPAVIAAVLPKDQNAFGAPKNCCTSFDRGGLGAVLIQGIGRCCSNGVGRGAKSVLVSWKH